MKPNAEVERGTQLEFRLKGTDQVRAQEFWGAGHAERAVDYMAKSNLRETTDHHKFTPLERDVV